MNPGYIAVHVVLPLLIGGTIYLFLRADHLFMFLWAEWLGLMPALESARTVTLPLRPMVPDWLLFSVPDGAWVYSFVAFFGRLWREGPVWAKVVWIGLGPAMAIGGELGQLIPGFVPGTYDWMDMFWYVVATVVSFAYAWNLWRRIPGPWQRASPEEPA